MNCPNCQCELTGKQKKFCSSACSLTFRNKTGRVYPEKILTCHECRNEFKTSRPKAKFCSRKCLSAWKSQAYTGRKIEGKWLENQNASKVREKIFRSGSFECKTCNKEFDNNLSARAHKGSCHQTTGNFTCEICDKTFDRSQKLALHVLCHDEKWAKDASIRSTEYANKRVTQSTSKEEIAFFKKLKELFSDVIHKFKFDGCNHEFDFFVPSQNLIIEYDGDFWHGNKPSDERSIRMKAQYMMDKEYTKKAIAAGYTVHRVWGSESSEYPNKKREFNV